MILRKSCVVCGKQELETFFELEDFPIRLGVDFPHESCPKMDMKWSECQSCGCVQLLELAPLDVLYQKTHNSSIGKAWDHHHESLSGCVLRHATNDNLSVIEVGGANLLLANKICAKSNSIKDYVIIDLACGEYDVEATHPQIRLERSTIQGFSSSQKFDILVHSHTFEHLYDPSETLLSLGKFLTDDGIMIMSIPNVSSQVKSGHLNSLHFEHTFYYDDPYLKKILNNSGFLIQEIVSFSPWNNFYICKKSKINVETKLSYDNRAKVDFIKMMTDLKKFVVDIERNEKEVFSFGAHIFSQYLYNFGLKEKLIGVLDNDITKNKRGNVLAGTKIPVYPVSQMLDLETPSIVLKVAQFHEEIVTQLLSTNKTSKIIW